MQRRYQNFSYLLTLTACLVYFYATPLANQVEAQNPTAGDCSCEAPAGGIEWMKKLILQKSLTCGTGWDLGKLSASQDFFKPQTDELIFDGLYKRMLYKARLEPANAAEQAIGNQYGFSEKEMDSLLNGDITPITDRTKKSLTFDEAILRMEDIRKAYETEREMRELESNLAGELAPLEIFANGTTDDSGFDLIVDLNVIQYILFGGELKSETWGGSGTGSGNSNNSNNNNNSNQNQNQNQSNNQTKGNDNEQNQPNNQPSQSNNQNPSGPNSNQPSSNSPNASEPSGNQNELKPEVDSSSGLDANQCEPENKELEAAITDFASTEGTPTDQSTTKSTNSDSTSKAGLKPPVKRPSSSSSGQDNKDQTGDNEQNGDDSDKDQTEGQKDQDTKPADPGDYPELPALCNGKEMDAATISYCVTFEKGTKVKYRKEDNCILCHIQYIKKTLKETIDHNLFPSKITGNLFEEPSCKNTKATGFLNINIWTIAQPFMPAIKPDIVTQTKAKGSLDKFAFWLQDLPVSLGKAGYGLMRSPDDPLEPAETTARNEVTAEAPTNATFEDITHRIDTLLRLKKDQAEQELRALEVSNQTSNQAGFARDIETEMNLMLDYFQSLLDIYTTMDAETCHGRGKDSGLMTKKQCT